MDGDKSASKLWKFKNIKAEPLRKADKSIIPKADVNAGNDLILRKMAGKLFRQSICL